MHTNLLLAQATPAPAQQPPASQGVADDFIAMISNVTPELARIGLVLLIAVVLFGITRRSVSLLVTQHRLSPGLALIVNRLTWWMTIIIVIFYTLQVLGVLQDAWTTLTAMIALVAIGFVAVWSVLSNLLCCFILLFTRPFMVGDTIELMGEPMKGRVIDFTLLYTVLQHEEGGVIRIPNNLFFQKAIRVSTGVNQVPLNQQIDQQAPQA
ncbi:MAG: mechanosensitive ion channel family protein [Phycisphaeraceae bacterium]